ncbi:MAG: rod-binding protein [Proteobacteria bacterium]|nr:rod-binding protein [Pseudomonadota bacterium]
MDEHTLVGREAALAREPGLPKLPKAGAKADAAKVREVAVEFEAVFLSEMLQHMFAGLPVDPLFGGGPGEEMYRGLLVEEYGKLLARSGGVGIADALQREVLRMQEVK